MVPNEAKYRAYFGRVLAANPKTRREAESELLAAVKLDSRNAQYHVMLAVLYRDLGFGKRAASVLEKALALDPQNSQAKQLLASLEK
jgi:Tfp pilus assembly protein PilF